VSKRTLPFLAFSCSLVAFASLGPIRDKSQASVATSDVAVSAPAALLPGKPSVIQANEASLVACISLLDTSCTKEWAAESLTVLGPKATVKLVNESRIDVIVTSCHSVMHTVGTLAQQTIKDQSLSVLLSHGKDSCQYGYQHGVMIGLALEIPDDDKFVKTVYDACAELPSGSYEVGACQHGIGHAATVRTVGDVVKAAETLCSKMPENAGTCVTGAVMEWVTSYSRAQYQKDPSVTDICSSLRDDYQTSCWREIPGLWVSLRESSTTSLQRCGNLQEDYMHECSKGVGYRSDKDSTCFYSNEEVAGYCLAGRAIVFFEIYHNTRNDASTVVCGAGETPRTREICTRELSPTVRVYEKMAEEKKSA
jgi:hypothetical protein